MTDNPKLYDLRNTQERDAALQDEGRRLYLDYYYHSLDAQERVETETFTAEDVARLRREIEERERREDYERRGS